MNIHQKPDVSYLMHMIFLKKKIFYNNLMVLVLYSLFTNKSRNCQSKGTRNVIDCVQQVFQHRFDNVDNLDALEILVLNMYRINKLNYKKCSSHFNC